jgi:hypothetical protein
MQDKKNYLEIEWAELLGYKIELAGPLGARIELKPREYYGAQMSSSKEKGRGRF